MYYDIISKYVIGQTTRILEIFLKFVFTFDLIASVSLLCCRIYDAIKTAASP